MKVYPFQQMANCPETVPETVPDSILFALSIVMRTAFSVVIPIQCNSGVLVRQYIMVGIDRYLTNVYDHKLVIQFKYNLDLPVRTHQLEAPVLSIVYQVILNYSVLKIITHSLILLERLSTGGQQSVVMCGEPPNSQQSNLFEALLVAFAHISTNLHSNRMFRHYRLI